MKNMKKRIAIVTKHTRKLCPKNSENGSFEHRPRLIPPKYWNKYGIINN